MIIFYYAKSLREEFSLIEDCKRKLNAKVRKIQYITRQTWPINSKNKDNARGLIYTKLCTKHILISPLSDPQYMGSLAFNPVNIKTNTFTYLSLPWIALESFFY